MVIASLRFWSLIPWFQAAAEPVVKVNASSIINPSVNKKFMGCHSDPGFAQTPRFFDANLVYSSSFGTGLGSQSWTAVPDWRLRVADGSAGSAGLDEGEAFSSTSSMRLSMDSDSGQIALVNRGIGGSGFALEAGEPYEVEVWIWQQSNVMAFVELRDHTKNASLARVEFDVTATGSPWGATWKRFNFTLVPSSGTVCEGIKFGSDPDIDCGGGAGDPSHLCVRCGGELLVGLSGKGMVHLGYTSLMPGAWGRVVDPDTGHVLPVLKSAGDTLKAMGITLMRSGGSVSQSTRWHDWRGPEWNRPSIRQVWGKSLLAGWGPFEVIDTCRALDIEPVLTFAYDTNDPLDFADLVEYCWGDAESTSWGQRRAADGHPKPYNITAFELGNEQNNPYFADQVLAMEKRAQQVGAPPLLYIFPFMNPPDMWQAEVQRLVDSGVPGDRLAPDLHVGATGAVEMARGVFDSFDQHVKMSAINLETNAGSHDHQRALNEAADLIDWFTADTSVTDRLYARTASFCSGTSAQFDTWDQGMSFFLPNMTWLQPPGHVHAMISQTWAEQTLQVDVDDAPADNSLHIAAQRSKSALVLRLVNTASTDLQTTFQLSGAQVAGPAELQTLQADDLRAVNVAGNPLAVSPQTSSLSWTSSGEIKLTLPKYSFTVVTSKFVDALLV